LLFECTEGFETREFGFPQQVDRGTCWYRVRDVIVPGGYECCHMLEVVDGQYTANYVRIRLERLSENFRQMPMSGSALPVPDSQSHAY